MQWKLNQANSEFVGNWVAIESQRIKQILLSPFKKESLKNLIFSLTPGLKSFSGD